MGDPKNRDVNLRTDATTDSKGSARYAGGRPAPMSDWPGHWWWSKNIRFLWGFSVGNYWGVAGKLFNKLLAINFLKAKA
jgi:hypothetical protein